MGFVIEDGKGRGYAAEVNPENELVVRSIVESEIEHASTEGNAYSWVSTASDIVSGETRLYVRNDNETPLIVDRINFNGSDVICEWTILLGSATTTPTGATVTGVNLNPTFASVVAQATAFDDETAVADGDLIDRVWTPVLNSRQHIMNGIILGINQYIQINQITESASGSVVLFGHFENPS